MEAVLLKILLVLLYAFLCAALLATTVGLPGNWILVAAALVIALATGFSTVTWQALLTCAALALLGEVVESVLGLVIVARRGASRWGVVGSLLGGFAGLILGAGVAPPLGSVILGFLGAFAGAVAGEFYVLRKLDPAVRIGYWAFIGRLAAMAGKMAAGCAILWIIVRTTWA